MESKPFLSEVKQVGRFPLFLLETAWGLAFSIFTNLETLCVAALAVCIGFASHSYLVALAVFFGVYTVFRMGTYWMSQLCNKLSLLARVMNEHGRLPAEVSPQRSDGNA